MVQELIEGLLCEAMVYVIHGEVTGFPHLGPSGLVDGLFQLPLRQYYRFPEHQAPPQYMHRKSAAQILGGEQVQLQVEDQMRSIVKQWIWWAKCMSASAVPFLRMDFLLADAGAQKVEVWTGEVSELGVAVELQGMTSHESRDLVMDAVMASVES